ncbi:MAG TPA: CofH family radical SAM protein, partial [Salinivirgaceae bacterium]|nr:CofH family radical SAM protein [Salinivirgaceae bacterium]
MTSKESTLSNIYNKIKLHQRISTDDAINLFEHATLGELAVMADIRRRKFNNDTIYYIRNIHIEPTNICQNRCKFCSYRRTEGDSDTYKLSHEQIIDRIKAAGEISEVHIVGGLHPDYDLDFYTTLFSSIRNQFPKIHRKGLTAEEIKYLSGLSGKTYTEVLHALVNSGLQSMPGGGAEIFDSEIRKKTCPDKLSGEDWLKIHETAHMLEITTNATMLYGHIEETTHRIKHLEAIRNLQDKTRGFNAFIPLKYCLSENQLGLTSEVSITDDLRTYAISRIFLDNIPHIKAYWP